MQESGRRDKSQVSSQFAIDIAQYSASAEEREITDYFLDLQEIKESPKKNTKTMRDLLVSGQPVQSESQKPFKFKALLEGKNNP